MRSAQRGRAGAGGHVPGDQVAQGGVVAGSHDAVEEGFLKAQKVMLALIPERSDFVSALCFHHIAEEGLVPCRSCTPRPN